ncbi:hypothetical protein JOD29_000787 [Lysinibacillus composti]|uniref:Uncharacterized protein n=1 Tax=Lysinibacillus composti TaxID=720633 RepID=A0A3N9UIW7_9BACI|nr:hypothetical protein [Lysinibacillus composti]MBM7607543.1 hypothetical protein [Lysinibacillus composti]RQW75950.1 hypothetical protein EBB45_04855 [Lysinibacillus composti]
MDLTQLNNEIFREKSCIDDLIKMISMHTQEGRYQQAARLGRDLQNSINHIQKLEQRKKFYITTENLAKKGILVKVVKRYEELVR